MHLTSATDPLLDASSDLVELVRSDSSSSAGSNVNTMPDSNTIKDSSGEFTESKPVSTSTVQPRVEAALKSLAQIEVRRNLIKV